MDKDLIQVGLWLFGGFGVIVTMLISWIAFMIREEKEQSRANYAIHDKRLAKNDKQHIKYDKKFAKQHNEIKGLITILSAKNNPGNLGSPGD